jgi:hypothetical protein
VNDLSVTEIKTLVLDVLKPHSPPLPAFAKFLSELEGIETVDVSLVEMDEKTESLKVVLKGSGINYEELKEHINSQGAVVHSVDQVIIERTG